MQPYQIYVNTIISAPTQKYPNREFFLQRLLGSGGEGGVYLAKQSNGGSIDEVALKLQRSIKDSEKFFLENIIQYQNTYENPNGHQYYPSYIIRMYETFMWNNTFIIVMELGKSNLYDYLKNNRTLELREKGIICSEISKSIHLLHYFGFAHRDIKPENYIRVGNQWKLCDFGLAKAHKDPFKTKNVGSICFTAPEVLDDGESYSEKVDIWSLGCVFYEIIEGKELFSGDNLEQIKEQILTSNKTKKHIGKNYIQEKINDLKISESWKKALFNMLQYEPSHRYSAQELISAIAPSIVPQMPSEKFIQKDLPFQIQGQKNKFNNLVYQTQKPLQFPSSTLQNKIIQTQTEQVQQNELNYIQQPAKDSCQRPQENQNSGYQVQNVDQSKLIKTLQVSSNNQFNVQVSKQIAPLVKQEENNIQNTQGQEDIPQKLGTVLQQEEQAKIQNQLNSNKIQNNEQQSFLQNQFANQGDQLEIETVTKEQNIQKTPLSNYQHEQQLEQKEINQTNQLQDDQNKNELQNLQNNPLEQVQGLEQISQQDCYLNETNITLSQYEQDILNFAQLTANSAHNIIISHNNKNIKVTDFGQDQQKTMKDLGVIIDKLNDQLKIFLQNY